MKIDNLDEVTILFGISDNNPGNCLLNQIIIFGKYTIYFCRCKNIKPSLSLQKAKTTEARKLEFSIAKNMLLHESIFSCIVRYRSNKIIYLFIYLLFFFSIAKYRVYSYK